MAFHYEAHMAVMKHAMESFVKSTDGHVSSTKSSQTNHYTHVVLQWHSYELQFYLWLFQNQYKYIRFQTINLQLLIGIADFPH